MESGQHTNAVDPRVLRHRLRATGYCPIPLYGKEPPAYGKNNKRKGLPRWQQLQEVTPEQIDIWARTWPEAFNTGVLTRLMPTLDLDILNEDAVCTIEDHVRKHYEERGYILIRIGLPPKRAIPFRTEQPFTKITINLVAPNGSTEKHEKIEFLGEGQQVVVAGTHPDTKQPYTWFGGEPGQIALADLPYIREAEARQLVDDVVELLVRDFGYTRAPERRKRPKQQHKGNYAGHEDAAAGAADWQCLFDSIREGRDLHNSLRDLAAKQIASGTSAGAAVNQLRALMECSTAPHDERWQDRYDDIPRAVDSAVEKYGTKPEAADPAEPAAAEVKSSASTSTVEDALNVFRRWLLLKDYTPVLAVLGTVAANYLEGDPVWLGLIGPPSSAKTEILNALSKLPHVVQAATVTPAGLLSGTPKKQRDKNASGGLLQQIGDFGIIVLKDFGSVLSMHTETRAETLAAFREIYDGGWSRRLGTDGGKNLGWKGKVGLLFAATGVIDSYYAAIAALGDRFLLTRLAPTRGQAQFDRALAHVGGVTKQMRKELADAVAQLFAGRNAQPRPINDQEAKEIGSTISLVVRLRGAVERDRRTREIEAVYGAEGTARIGLALERLLAALDTLDLERATAMQVVLSVAMDSVPPLRRAAYDCVSRYDNVETADVAIALGLPTNTVRRILEDLTAYGLVERKSQGQGKPDLWSRTSWEAEQ